MIYIAILLYLLYLTIRYDILEFQAYKQVHFVVVIIILICVSGFRYRLGTDSYVYEVNVFSYYSSLSNLSSLDFGYFRLQPTWVLLNSLGRTLGGFVYVQIITSIIHIGLWGYVIRRICPALMFSSLFVYYIYDFTAFNMEVMREGMAVSLFLCSLVELNAKKFLRYILFALLAYMFHSFSIIASISYLLFYLFLSKNIHMAITSVLVVAIICAINKNFIIDILINTALGSSNTTITYAASYATSVRYGESDYSWKGLLTRFSLPVIYGYILYKVRVEYYNYVKLNWRIFTSAIFIAMTFLVATYALVIIGRMYNYFHMFSFLLIALYIKSFCKRYSPQQQVRYAFLLLLIPLGLATNDYLRTDSLADTEKYYSRYYPYSSVFDKSIDNKREVIMMNKIWMIDQIAK